MQHQCNGRRAIGKLNAALPSKRSAKRGTVASTTDLALQRLLERLQRFNLCGMGDRQQDDICNRDGCWVNHADGLLWPILSLMARAAAFARSSSRDPIMTVCPALEPIAMRSRPLHFQFLQARRQRMPTLHLAVTGCRVARINRRRVARPRISRPECFRTWVTHPANRSLA